MLPFLSISNSSSESDLSSTIILLDFGSTIDCFSNAFWVICTGRGMKSFSDGTRGWNLLRFSDSRVGGVRASLLIPFLEVGPHDSLRLIILVRVKFHRILDQFV
jgi:hypothetical protein